MSPVLNSRRGHLMAAAATGTQFALGVAGLLGPDAPPLRIDAHAHALPPSYRAAVLAARINSATGMPFPDWSESLALNFMRRYGIRAQVVSISDPGVEFLPAPEGVALARSVNDELASLIQRRPDRFAALAVLPMRDVPASIRESRRALDVLGLDGVGLLSNYDGEYLGAPRFEPLLAELDRRGAYVFLHPATPARGDRPAGGLPDPVVEFPFETTRAVDSLLRADAIRRYPRIRWHLAHAGGLVPALTDRLGRDLAYDPLPPLATLRYDTALSSSPWAMAGTFAIAPPERVLFATDWPFTNLLFLFAGTPQPELSVSIPSGQRSKVLADNVLGDLPRLAAAIGRADG